MTAHVRTGKRMTSILPGGPTSYSVSAGSPCLLTHVPLYFGSADVLPRAYFFISSCYLGIIYTVNNVYRPSIRLSNQSILSTFDGSGRVLVLQVHL